jgi:glucose/arabinose dehydrogenase
MALFITVIVVALVAGIGAYAYFRQRPADPPPGAYGQKPGIPLARPQAIPTLKLPRARGWRDGQKPAVATGLRVEAFATGLIHPRWLYQLPDGDVLVAESSSIPGRLRSPRDIAMRLAMRRAGALHTNANRISRLRDADGDGVAETRETFLSGLNQPFGMALIGDSFYVGNTDSLVVFPYEPGAPRITGPGRPLASMKPGGHWTRNLLASPDGARIYIGVGSKTNIADDGFALEEGRAMVQVHDLASGETRPFATGLRNPVGLAIEPRTGVLWTVVNERDGLGDETPPDYLTSVVDGGFYGWPYCYWGQTVDDRVQPQDKALVARALTPDYALGGHTASLGLCWLPEGTLPGLPAGMVIGQHGSWNRSKLSGYKVILVPFADGKPTGAPPIDILSGFLSADERHSNGRPVGVLLAKDGSLLVADDVGHCIWRVTGA